MKTAASRRNVVGLSVLLLAGCATLTPEGAKVRITNNPQATAGCKFLGNVKGKFDNDLRSEAAKLGADVVFNMTQPNEPHIWQHGEAYSCEQEKL
jgi:hypothetical protein